MDPLYATLLDPALYTCSRTARFIDALIDPTIDTTTTEAAEQFCDQMPATDDILLQIEHITRNAQNKITQNGGFQCFITIYPINHAPVTIFTSIPINPSDIDNLLSAIKCLAFSHKAQSVFFASEIYHCDNQPILGKQVPPDADWGIQVIGSSARGNTFKSLTTISEQNGKLQFESLPVKIGRERQSTYPFSKFFHIQDCHDLTNIISQLPTVNIPIHHVTQKNLRLDEKQIITNFMTLLKSLNSLGYDK